MQSNNNKIHVVILNVFSHYEETPHRWLKFIFCEYALSRIKLPLEKSFPFLGLGLCLGLSLGLGLSIGLDLGLSLGLRFLGVGFLGLRFLDEAS